MTYIKIKLYTRNNVFEELVRDSKGKSINKGEDIEWRKIYCRE